VPDDRPVTPKPDDATAAPDGHQDETLQPGVYRLKLGSESWLLLVLDAQPIDQFISAYRMEPWGASARIKAEWMQLVLSIPPKDLTVLERYATLQPSHVRTAPA
jgi:hypothetical protein